MEIELTTVALTDNDQTATFAFSETEQIDSFQCKRKRGTENWKRAGHVSSRTSFYGIHSIGNWICFNLQTSV